MLSQRAIITGLHRLMLDAMQADRRMHEAAVIDPILAALESVNDSGNDSSDYRTFRSRCGVHLVETMGLNRSERAERLGVHASQSYLIGHVYSLGRLDRKREAAAELVASSARFLAYTAAEDKAKASLREKLRAWVRSFRRSADVTEAMFKPAPNREALRIFNNKTIFTSTDFEKLTDAMKARAFRVWEVNDLGVVQSIRDHIDASISEGLDFRAFRNNLKATLEAAGEPNRPLWHASTVYQTNIAAAYSDAKNDIINTDLARAVFPYRRYMTRMNATVRPSHAALHGLVYPSDHAFWNTYDPPWDYNCRCYTEILTAEEAGTVQDSMPDVPPARDFTRASPASSFTKLDDDLQRELERTAKERKAAL